MGEKIVEIHGDIHPDLIGGRDEVIWCPEHFECAEVVRIFRAWKVGTPPASHAKAEGEQVSALPRQLQGFTATRDLQLFTHHPPPPHSASLPPPTTA